MTDLYGGIEAGGTKFVCAIASGPDRVVAETTFPTTTPTQTISQAIAFFRDHQAQYPLKGLGIATLWPGRSETCLAHLGLHHHNTQTGLGANPICYHGARHAEATRWL